MSRTVVNTKKNKIIEDTAEIESECISESENYHIPKKEFNLLIFNNRDAYNRKKQEAIKFYGKARTLEEKLKILEKAYEDEKQNKDKLNREVEIYKTKKSKISPQLQELLRKQKEEDEQEALNDKKIIEEIESECKREVEAYKKRYGIK